MRSTTMVLNNPATIVPVAPMITLTMLLLPAWISSWMFSTFSSIFSKRVSRFLYLCSHKSTCASRFVFSSSVAIFFSLPVSLSIVLLVEDAYCLCLIVPYTFIYTVLCFIIYLFNEQNVGVIWICGSEHTSFYFDSFIQSYDYGYQIKVFF